MQKLTREDLHGLEDYAQARPAFRARVLEHKRSRKLPIGANATLYFEDRLTIQYQVQEMLRAERIFERAAIDEELAAYNPLIPDGMNLKATFMLEFPDAAERREALARLRGIEERVWLRIGERPPVFAVADEDLARATEEKTSAVHFLRFELGPTDVEHVRAGEPWSAGIDHPAYRESVSPIPEAVRLALAADLA